MRRRFVKIISMCQSNRLENMSKCAASTNIELHERVKQILLIFTFSDPYNPLHWISLLKAKISFYRKSISVKFHASEFYDASGRKQIDKNLIMSTRPINRPE